MQVGLCFFFQAEDGIRDLTVTGVQTCALPIYMLLATQRRFVEGMCGVIEDGIVPGLWGYEAGQSGAGDIYAWLFRTVGVSPAFLTEKALALQPGQTRPLALDWWVRQRPVLAGTGPTGLLVG